MAEQSDVKVFVSWSGDLAKAVAFALRESLSLLSDRFIPWVSEADIEAGQRGLAQIEGELRDTRFGVVVVTAENQHAPWLNFEAGALSKAIAGDVEQRVVPLLVDLASPAQVTGPLSQFQAKVADREGVLALLRSLAAVAGVDEQVVATRFEDQWPRLEAKIAEVKQKHAAAEGEPRVERRDQADVLDEILLHVRQLRVDREASTTATRDAAIRRRLAHETAVRDTARHLARDATDPNGVLGKLAAQHGLDIHSASVTAAGVLDVAVSPQREFSQDAADVFEGALRALLPDGVGLQYTAIPF